MSQRNQNLLMARYIGTGDRRRSAARPRWWDCFTGNFSLWISLGIVIGIVIGTILMASKG